MTSTTATDSAPRRQTAQPIITAAALVIIMAGLRSISDAVLNPLLLALFITVIVSPVMSWGKRRGLSPAFTIILVLLGLVFLAMIAVALLGTALQQFLRQLPEYTDLLSEQEQVLIQWLDSHGFAGELQGKNHLFDPSAAASLLSQFINGLISLLGKSVIIIVLVGFMLAEIAWLPGKIRSASRDSERTMNRAALIAQNIRKYIAIKTQVSLLTGVLIYLGTSFLGVPSPIVWGFMAFLLNYIPNIGSIIASIPAIAIAYLSPQGIHFAGLNLELGSGATALLTAGLYICVNQLFGSFIEPRWQGRGLGLSPLVVFISLLFWGWMLGPIGMLVSAPLTMAVKIALEGYDDSRWLSILLGGNPDSVAQDAPSSAP